jgi:hypothetical protein
MKARTALRLHPVINIIQDLFSIFAFINLFFRHQVKRRFSDELRCEAFSMLTSRETRVAEFIVKRRQLKVL